MVTYLQRQHRMMRSIIRTSPLLVPILLLKAGAGVMLASLIREVYSAVLNGRDGPGKSPGPKESSALVRQPCPAI